MSRLLSFCALFLSIVSLNAQERSGNTVVERQGIVLVKAQAWSSPADAELVKFSAFTDRTARGASGAGYFVLRLPSGKDTQVQVSQIVKMVLRPELPKELLEDSQRQFLQKQIDDIVSASANFPAARIPLTDYAKPLQEAARRYDSGEVIDNGVWLTRKKFTEELTKKIETRLRAAMLEAKNKKEFDLESNADFKKLRKMADSDPVLATRVAALQADYAKLLVQENQDAILAKLQSPLSPADAAPIIQQLSEIPEKSLRTVSVLKQAATAADLSKEIEAAALELEGIWNSDDLAQGKVPRIPDELGSRIDALVGRGKVFRAGLPPAGIWVPVAVLNSSAALKNGLPLLQAELEARNYRTAIEKVTELAPTVRLVGPKTEVAFDAMKDYPNAEISKFSTLVEEGNVLLAAGNKKQAALKFQEALNVMPDAGIESRLSEIK